MTVRIGVLPPGERQVRANLFAALEAAFPVEFVAGDAGAGAVVSFGVPSPSDGRPRLHYVADEAPADGDASVRFASDPTLARPLHGACLRDRHVSGAASIAGGPALAASPGARVLASVDGAPVWSVRGADHEVAVGPLELAPDHALRSRLAPGRSLALLTLVQFIRTVLGRRGWELPGPRAAFVIDDPNLRWPRYGHIDYAELRRSACAHGYHVSIAMVPLDGRIAHPGAVRQFRDGPEQISLCIHGNNHDGPELRRPASHREAMAVAAQAIRRMSAFEQRTGVSVDRVMVPPHERINEHVARALVGCGFEALSCAQPYPWIAQSPDIDWLTRPTGSGPLTGWRSGELIEGGLPVLLRMDLGHPREEIVIRAFLGQPVILYGHHDMLSEGTGELESVAAEVGRVGPVRWGSLTEIARAAVESLCRNGVLELRMLARRVDCEVPEGIGAVNVDATALGAGEGAVLRLRSRSATGPVEVASAPVNGGSARLTCDRPGRFELELEPGESVDLDAVPAPRVRPGPLVRRFATEWRDRSQTVLTAGRR